MIPRKSSFGVNTRVTPAKADLRLTDHQRLRQLLGIERPLRYAQWCLRPQPHPPVGQLNFLQGPLKEKCQEDLHLARGTLSYSWARATILVTSIKSMLNGAFFALVWDTRGLR